MKSARTTYHPPAGRRGLPAALAAALLLAVLAAGCHAGRKAAAPKVPPADGTTDTAVAVELPPRPYTVINFEATVQGLVVDGQLRLAEDSVLWLSATKVVEVGRALATPDSLWLRAPLLGRDEAMDYAALRRTTGVAITFDEMQQMLLADDAEERLNALARRLGLEATLRIKARRRVDRLTFPYPKTIRQQ